MFKTVATTLISALVFHAGAMAQIYVKQSGNVGIGINTPTEKLHVAGKITVEGNTGDLINLKNNTSTNFWVNMNFWQGGSRQAWLGLDPSNNFSITKDLPGDISVYPNQGNLVVESIKSDPDIGAGLTLRHSLKGNPVGGSNTAREWVLYNMAGHYGSGLEFWAYSNGGCGAPGGLCNPMVTFADNGNVGIAENFPIHKLHVNGEIYGEGYLVKYQNSTSIRYPDYVFESAYQLPALRELEEYIKKNHHLPEVPTEEEVTKDGMNLGNQQVLLLKKIEELTLYVIDQNKKQTLLEEKLNEVLMENKEMKEKIKAIEQHKQ